jgi:hypothetical protein
VPAPTLEFGVVAVVVVVVVVILNLRLH